MTWDERGKWMGGKHGGGIGESCAEVISPIEFRVPAKDHNNESVRNYFRSTPQMQAVVDDLIASKKFPLRKRGDFYRLATLRLIQELERQSPAVTVTGQMYAMNEILEDDQKNSDFLEVFRKLEERVSHHMASASNGEAMRLILTTRRFIEKMPDGYWKGKYTEELERRYGHLVEESPKASLRSL